MAVAIEDFTVKVIDVDTRKIVRNFTGHQHSITDMVRYLPFVFIFRFFHICK